MQDAMNRHMGNMSRLSGGDGMTARYSYAIDTEDMMHQLGRMHEDLLYDLAIDSRYKRAIVYNKKGLEKAIRECVNKCIAEALSELGYSVADNVVNEIVRQLNGIMQLQNGQIVVKNNGRSNSDIDRFANMLVKGLVRETGKIIEDMVDGDGRKK